MLLRRRESASRQRQSEVDRSSRAIKCESGRLRDSFSVGCVSYRSLASTREVRTERHKTNIRTLPDETSEDDEIDETRFVFNRQNTFMCFSTDNLKFLDMVNFLAPDYSYDKYLKAYWCKLQKGNFSVRVHGRCSEIGRLRSTTAGRVLQSAQKLRRIRRRLRSLTGRVARQQNDHVARMSSGTATVTSHSSSKPSTNSLPSTNSSISICSKTG